MKNRHKQLQPKGTKTVATTKFSQLSLVELDSIAGGPVAMDPEPEPKGGETK